MNNYSNPQNRNNTVFAWLLILTIMTFCMVLIGGLTRLTDSGLSMVDWRPLLGILPPLNENSWVNAFDAYKSSPEYMIVNKSMELENFKYIYWWEWFHRFLARCLGLALIIPMTYFVITKRI